MAAIGLQDQSAYAASPGQTDRIVWLDYAKGIAIILVVLGHVLRGLRPEVVGERILDYGFLDDLIYTFHMPLFFFISGFLFVGRSQADLPRFARALVIGLVVPYIIWSVIFVALQNIAPGGVNHRLDFADLLTMYWRPIGHMWFLHSLLIAEIIFFSGRRILGIAGVCMITAFYTASYFADWAFPPALRYATIMGGTFVGFGLITGLMKPLPKSTTVIATIMAATAAIWALVMYIDQSHGAEHIQYQAAVTAIAAVAGVAMSIAAALLIPAARGFATRMLAQLGEASLAIFVCHTIFAAALRIALHRSGVVSPEIHLVAGR